VRTVAAMKIYFDVRGAAEFHVQLRSWLGYVPLKFPEGTRVLACEVDTNSGAIYCKCRREGGGA
jgi:hypothetical protein